MKVVSKDLVEKLRSEPKLVKRNKGVIPSDIRDRSILGRQSIRAKALRHSRNSKEASVAGTESLIECSQEGRGEVSDHGEYYMHCKNFSFDSEWDGDPLPGFQ